MGTRAIYTFTDEWGKYFIYKQSDNDPGSAAEFIRNALKQSWELPRFEADEFAAAFISANKKRAGDISLAQSEDAIDDLAFHYEVSCKEERLYVKAFSYENMIYIFDGFLDDFEKGYIST